MSGSVLRAQSLEPASDSMSPSLSAPPLITLSLSLKNKQTLNKFKNENLSKMLIEQIQNIFADNLLHARQ